MVTSRDVRKAETTSSRPRPELSVSACCSEKLRLLMRADAHC
ncbi:hypothetical protein CFter6_2491 [Collimonas fungivorans]|uniref:Uncharacterized protein n=1 Tax=Collimonas fungivorans TaxID=158899 RepID=A0A127PBN6_9BURK|nr:hypothetical protein CFter6_2491 [Collimonas fungivorans]